MQRHTDLAAIKSRVSEVIGKSVVGRHLQHVDLVEDQDGDGDNFIRVQVKLDTFEDIDDDDLLALMRNIEIMVDELDDRFASVRFSDAA